MLSRSVCTQDKLREASVFPTPYEKQILRLRLRMTLRHSLQGGEYTERRRVDGDRLIEP